MHQYLRAVGFSNIRSKKDLKALVNDVIVQSSEKDYIETDRDSILVEYGKDYSPSTGIMLRSEIDEDEQMTMDFYYPYVRGHQVSITEDIVVERHAQKESFAGVAEDNRVGVTLIFFIRNGMTIMKRLSEEEADRPQTTVSLSALSLSGTVLLPIKKNAHDIERIKNAAKVRNERIDAAKNGDENAMEQLTLEDIDTYSAISKRLPKEDVFTLVDSFFMPYGVECDQYSVMGEIVECAKETNYLTGENLYIMDINSNGLMITVSINEEDLLGEPIPGRRFKGSIWLLGEVNV